MVKDSLTTFGPFALHFGTGVALLFIGIFLFNLTTKHNEYKLAFVEGNIAAGILIAGNVLGLFSVLGGAAANSVDYTDFIVWGFVGVVSQIVVYHVFDLLIFKIKFSEAIENKNISVAIVIASVLIGVGLFISKCMTW